MRERVRRFACASAAALVAGLTCASGLAAPPQRLMVQYDLSRNGSVMMEVIETLEHDGRGYRIESEARGKGLFALANRGAVKRSSRGTVASNGIKPVEFRDQRGSRAPEVARFDWTRRVVVQEREGRSQTIPITDDMQDRLSFAWGFAFAPPLGKEVAATIADGRGTTRYHYTVAGKETLKTAAGEIETLHLVKRRDGDEDRATEMWLALRNHFVPVRILVVEKDGTRLDQLATRLDSKFPRAGEGRGGVQ